MPGTSLPRNVIYYNDGSVPLGNAISLPYTDVILAFLVPADPVDGDYTLRGRGGAFDSSGNPNATDIQALQDAGQNVLISVGGQVRGALQPGQAGWTSAAWQYYAQNQDSLVQQVVTYVRANGLSGVDIDYEDDNGFTGAYDGSLSKIEFKEVQSYSRSIGRGVRTERPPVIGVENTPGFEMSDCALNWGAQPIYLGIEFLLPVKQFPALRLLKRGDEARALIALVADPAEGSRHDICGFCLGEGCHVVIMPGNGLGYE